MSNVVAPNVALIFNSMRELSTIKHDKLKEFKIKIGISGITFHYRRLIFYLRLSRYSAISQWHCSLHRNISLFLNHTSYKLTAIVELLSFNFLVRRMAVHLIMPLRGHAHDSRLISC